MFNKNSNFTISLLSKIIGESIEYFIPCMKIRQNLDKETVSKNKYTTLKGETPTNNYTTEGNTTKGNNYEGNTTEGNTIDENLEENNEAKMSIKIPNYLTILGIDPMKKKKKTSLRSDEIIFICNSSLKFIG